MECDLDLTPQGQGQETPSPKKRKSAKKIHQQQQQQQQQQEQQQPWQEWQELLDAEPENIETYSPKLKDPYTPEIPKISPTKSILKSPRSASNSNTSAENGNSTASHGIPKHRNVQFQGVPEQNPDPPTKLESNIDKSQNKRNKLDAINTSPLSQSKASKGEVLAPLVPKNNSLLGQPLGRMPSIPKTGEWSETFGQPNKVGQSFQKIGQSMNPETSIKPVVAPLQASKLPGSRAEDLAPIRKEIKPLEASLESRQKNHPLDFRPLQPAKLTDSKVWKEFKFTILRHSREHSMMEMVTTQMKMLVCQTMLQGLLGIFFLVTAQLVGWMLTSQVVKSHNHSASF